MCKTNPDVVCFITNQGGNQNVTPGIFVSHQQTASPAFPGCPTGISEYSDIFIYGMGATGEGSGYVNINGCFDSSTPTETVFWDENNQTPITNYQQWFNEVFGN